MELKVQEYKLPDAISFNFEELKTAIAGKTEQYAAIVYTEDNIKAAKEDRADLNRLKKALNDERLRRQKEYMKPFDAFKAQIDEIISIIDKPVLAIDKQIKEYELIKQDEKKNNIEDMFNDMLFPEFVSVDRLWNPKWLNATFSMKQVEEELLNQKNRIISECQTLATLPNYSHEAVHFYQKTLSIEQALGKVRELTEAEAAKQRALEAEAKRQAAEEEARQKALLEAQQKAVDETFAPVPEVVKEEPKPAPVNKMWVAFEAYIDKNQGAALKTFFENNNIDFRPIKMKEDK